VTWNPRLVNTPVPTMFATTMDVAVVSDTVGMGRRLSLGLVTAGSMKSGPSGQVVGTAELLMICRIAESASSLNMRVALVGEFADTSWVSH